MGARQFVMAGILAVFGMFVWRLTGSLRPADLALGGGMIAGCLFIHGVLLFAHRHDRIPAHDAVGAAMPALGAKSGKQGFALQMMLLALLIFLGLLAWSAGSRLSEVALGLCVGLVFGVLSGVPSTVLMMAVQRKHPVRDYATARPPAVVVVGTPRPRHLILERKTVTERLHFHSEAELNAALDRWLSRQAAGEIVGPFRGVLIEDDIPLVAESRKLLEERW